MLPQHRNWFPQWNPEAPAPPTAAASLWGARGRCLRATKSLSLSDRGEVHVGALWETSAARSLSISPSQDRTLVSSSFGQLLRTVFSRTRRRFSCEHETVRGPLSVLVGIGRHDYISFRLNTPRTRNSKGEMKPESGLQFVVL